MTLIIAGLIRYFLFAVGLALVSRGIIPAETWAEISAHIPEAALDVAGWILTVAPPVYWALRLKIRRWLGLEEPAS